MKTRYSAVCLKVITGCLFLIQIAAATPERPVLAELTEFSLCELDRTSLEQLSPCIRASVPGDIVSALLSADRVPDPYRDFNSNQVQWVDERAWRYETTFEYQPLPGKRAHLLFMGLDYISKIELNGKILVPKHEGMFSRVDLDITDALDPSGSQQLAVTLFGLQSATYDWMGKSFSSIEFGRRKYLKTQMSFNWDFAPRLKSAGIWDRVYLYETGPLGINDIFIKTSLDGRVEVEVELSGHTDSQVSLEVEIAGHNFSSSPIKQTLALGSGSAVGPHKLAFRFSKPKLWWPWDMGEPNLYRAKVRVLVAGRESAAVSETFGIREISWGPNPDAPQGSYDWVLFINGKREFMRGANWVPPEAMHGRLTKERYQQLIDMTRGMNANLLRMWGGGNRERREFYDYCDEQGIMVWQEFPFACVYIVGYPRTPRFKNLVAQEVEEMTRQLRNHPSIIMWCGGNEFNALRNRHVVKIMQQTTDRLDPTRRFIQASPYKGDAHNWVVWHSFGNLDDYFDDISPVASEFGLQAFPHTDTLGKWISEDLLWPLGDVHEHHDLGRGKMEKYMAAIGYGDNLESVTQTSQIMQAHFLQRGIENWRQRKYATSGTVLWQLNEPWPAICWSVIDYELRPKLAYEMLKDTYNPLLTSAKFEDRKWQAGDGFSAEIIAVNDLHREFSDVTLTARVCGREVATWERSIPEDDVVHIGILEVGLPSGCDKPYLDLDLSLDGQLISKNHYELWVHDPVPAGRFNRGTFNIGMWLMSGSRQKQWSNKEK